MTTTLEDAKTALADAKRAVTDAEKVVADLEVTPPVEPPIEPPAASLVVAVDTSGWGGSLHDELTKGGIIFRRVNTPAVISEVESKGGKVATCDFHAGNPLNFTPATYASELVKEAHAHPNVERWEVLNEPELAWSAAGKPASMVTHYVELLAAARRAFTAGGIKAKLIASWAPTYGFGKAWAAAGGLQYVDEVVVHAYGGSSGQHKGLEGGRELIEEAHTQTGLPVAVTEVGWPTAVGKPSTGDSQQWSEAQQAEAITKFIAWAKTKPFVSLVVIFNAVDYGTNNYYGIERTDRSHKPSFAALAAAAK